MNRLDEINFGSKTVPVVVLVGTMDMASKIVKSAKAHHLEVRNFDKADRLLRVCLTQTPKVIVLDFETREAEAFRFLKARHENAELKKAAVVGFVISASFLRFDDD